MNKKLLKQKHTNLNRLNKEVTKRSKRRFPKYFPILGSMLLGIILIVTVYVFQLKMSTDLQLWQIIQNLANPSIRYVKITEGMRQEEVADRFAKVLGWSDTQKQSLLKMHTLAFAGKSEGYFYPETYIFTIKATPKDVSKKIYDTFNEQVVAKQAEKPSVISMDTAIKIASIIQRETADKNDMKIISGIIWNRLFSGMKLDMDATLQYAKGTNEKWWPQVSLPIKK
jgi:cell division protein YceG involved in septum cleavage